jgi:hypothetical protein
MDLLNYKVRHTIFGVGTVTEFDGKYITIQFADKSSKFVYPDAFEKFIKAEDSAVQEAILNYISAAKKAEEERRQAELTARKAEEDSKVAEEAVKCSTVLQRTGYTSKPATRSQRIEGKRMTFFVFQGNTFDKEFRGGYIWAPISNKSGTMPHHWTRLLDVRKGDIILHGCDGYVRAISVACGACYDCPQPVELTVEELWDREGRRVDCDYTQIVKPIKTSAFTDDIIRLCQAKYSPFDKNGNGNMGYLFEINRELAKIFVEASVKQNLYLASIDYIRELLMEGSDD